MNPKEISLKDNPNTNTLTSKKFLHLNGFFVIDAPCIFCENKIIRVQEKYDLLDFLDNGHLSERTLKFWYAVLKGYTLKIILLDTKTGKLLHRTHRMDNDSIPCDWLLIEKDYFNPDKGSDEKAIESYCNGE